MKNKLTYIILAAALLIGLFMRGWQYKERFMYNHDNDLSSWMVRDVVVNRHFRLIGQQTSEPGIFIGPLFYYSLIPFYMVFNMDPLGGVFYSIGVGLIAVVSIYFVFRKLYSPSAGGFAALLYAASLAISMNERDVVPTTPVILWSIWLYYAVNLLFQGKKPLLLAAVLFALVWHLNLALVLLSPLVLLGVAYHIKKYKLTDFIAPILLFIAVSLPLIVFELRHDFVQSRALVSSLTRIEQKTGLLSDKITHVILYAARNSTAIIYPEWPSQYSVYLLPVVLLISTIFLVWRKYVPRYTVIIYLAWILLYIFFFTAHPINLSEYYLNGMNVLTFASSALLLSWMFQKTLPVKLLSILLVSFIIYYNLNLFIKSPINRSGYVERTAIVDYIKTDASLHNFPCVSVSYITHPGYNLGYRYLFWRAGLHVNQPHSGSPVYTIVFPHSLVNHLDKTFGALGLILPDYSRYSTSDVSFSCSGANANITDPMFGYTE